MKEPADFDPFWKSVMVGDADPTSGGASYLQVPCLYYWPDPDSQYGGWRCTREIHKDRIHVATAGTVRAVHRS